MSKINALKIKLAEKQSAKRHLKGYQGLVMVEGKARLSMRNNGNFYTACGKYHSGFNAVWFAIKQRDDTDAICKTCASKFKNLMKEASSKTCSPRLEKLASS